MARKRKNSRTRCPDHDYRSRCIYHVVLNKAEGFSDFSFVKGIPGDRQWKPKAEPFPPGIAIREALRFAKRDHPSVKIYRQCIMPDHVHLVLFLTVENALHLGDYILSVKLRCSEAWERMGHAPEVRFFSEGYHDTILKGNGQLKKMCAYVSDNPRRWLVRRQSPGYFRRFSITDGEETYEAFGNWDLLDEWDLNAVKISRTFGEEELVRRKWIWKEAVENDGVLVSPFISKAEKKVRDWAVENGGAIIDITTEPFGERYKPSGRYFDLCAEGRLLVISMPMEGRELSREDCDRMNEFAEDLEKGKRWERLL